MDDIISIEIRYSEKLLELSKSFDFSRLNDEVVIRAKQEEFQRRWDEICARRDEELTNLKSRCGPGPKSSHT